MKSESQILTLQRKDIVNISIDFILFIKRIFSFGKKMKNEPNHFVSYNWMDRILRL